jgi:hypothetical protein
MGTLTLDTTVVALNTSPCSAGAINNSGTLTIEESTITANSAGCSFGGIRHFGPSMTIRNSTISGNSAQFFGGGLGQDGGSSTTTLNNVTITNNTSGISGTGGGGGIHVSSGTVNTRNTIIAGNTDNDDTSPTPDCNGTLASQGYNLVQSTAGCTITGTLTGNITGVSAALGTLQDNGGPTTTHKPLLASLALDGGNPLPAGSGGNACEANDQRGEPRWGDGNADGITNCDIGAFESQVENVDPGSNGSQYAYGENVGWINAEPTASGGPGLLVTNTRITGYMWGENIGWVNMSCTNNSTCGTSNYGVTNDGAGNLAGYAWSENAGWISFSCANTAVCGTKNYGVKINPGSGVFTGNAWGENIGWITFSGSVPSPYRVRTGWRGAIDSDGDGCTDVQEQGPSIQLGGLRNPTVYWDFFDTPSNTNVRDKSISVADISRVVARFGSSYGGPISKGEAFKQVAVQPPPAPAYHVAFDRTTSGALTGPPDGAVSVQDISRVVAQFGHSCM